MEPFHLPTEWLLGGTMRPGNLQDLPTLQGVPTNSSPLWQWRTSTAPPVLASVSSVYPSGIAGDECGCGLLPPVAL